MGVSGTKSGLMFLSGICFEQCLYSSELNTLVPNYWFFSVFLSFSQKMAYNFSFFANKNLKKMGNHRLIYEVRISKDFVFINTLNLPLYLGITLFMPTSAVI